MTNLPSTLPTPDNQTSPQSAQTLFFTYQKARVAYHKYGNGPICLISFHGYGQDASVFGPLADARGSDYTLYSFDLFFHGQSHWPNGQLPLDKAWLKAMFADWANSLGIAEFEVCGFSMGARFALCIYESFPEKVAQVWLIAPDGLKINFWYAAATELKLSRRFFKYLIFKPNLFFGLTRLLYNCRLLHSSALRFASSQMNTRRKRWRVFSSWTIFRKVWVKNPTLIHLFNYHKTPLTIFLGRYDRILPAQNSYKIAAKIKGCQIKVLESGHSNLLEKVAQYYQNKGRNQAKI